MEPLIMSPIKNTSNKNWLLTYLTMDGCGDGTRAYHCTHLLSGKRTVFTVGLDIKERLLDIYYQPSWQQFGSEDAVKSTAI